MTQVLEKKSLSEIKKNMNAYINDHDIQYVAEDAVFTNLSTGEKTVGREAIGQMLNHIYHVAFDAKAEVKQFVITEDHATLEATFIGKHIGEIAGIQPTQKDVRVPLCVTYDLEDGYIKEARIYMLVNVMMDQLKTD